MSPTGSTRLAAVIGDPVRHSLSPVLHNAAFEALGLDWTYVAFEVAAGRSGDALAAVRALGIAGLSVTMPHKAAILDGLDDVSPVADALGAVNCVTNQRGRLVGDNTDAPGFVTGLAHDTSLDLAASRVVVVGAGGAARAVIRGLADAGAREVIVVNRTGDRARAAAALADDRGRVGDITDVKAADLVVNATSVGMGDQTRAVPFDPALIAPGQVVVDIVYEPQETRLLAELRANGVEAYNGLSMLLFQAARAFELWTGETAPVSAMSTAVRSVLAR